MLHIDIKGNIDESTIDVVNSAIASPKKEVTLHIDSLGGSLDAGFRCWDSIRMAKDKVFFAKVEGNCMSSASIILCSVPVERRSATPHSVFLIHNPLIETYGTQNLMEIRHLADSMQSASEQIKAIYRERTTMDNSLMESLMNTETEFYADKALEYGLIGRVEELYNKHTRKCIYNKTQIKRKTMRKNFLNALANAVIGRLLNESYLTTDGQEIDLDAVEVGAVANCPDGVYELAEDGTVVTVENGQVTDIVKKDEETSEEELTNEGESEEAVVEEAQEALEEVATVAEEAESAETVEEVQEIAEQIEEIVKEQFEEVIAKYKSLQNLVKACGGEAKLKALANVKHEKKAFTTVSNSKNKGTRSIKELVALKRK